jgi:hypothetical protein
VYVPDKDNKLDTGADGDEEPPKASKRRTAGNGKSTISKSHKKLSKKWAGHIIDDEDMPTHTPANPSSDLGLPTSQDIPASDISTLETSSDGQTVHPN